MLINRPPFVVANILKAAKVQNFSIERSPMEIMLLVIVVAVVWYMVKKKAVEKNIVREVWRAYRNGNGEDSTVINWLSPILAERFIRRFGGNWDRQTNSGTAWIRVNGERLWVYMADAWDNETALSVVHESGMKLSR